MKKKSGILQNMGKELQQHTSQVEEVYEQRNMSLTSQLENISEDHNAIDLEETQLTKQLLDTNNSNHDDVALRLLEQIKNRSEQTQAKITEAVIEILSNKPPSDKDK